MSSEIIPARAASAALATVTTGAEPLRPAVSILPDEAVLNTIERMADIICNSGLFGIKDRRQAVALMLVCYAEGRNPIEAARRYDIIQGRPTMKAGTMQAEFQAAGGIIEFHQRDEQACDATLTHGKSTVRVRWDMDRARKAKLAGKETWQTYPAAMLHARCISEGVRAILPGAVLGIYTPDEAEEIAKREQGEEPARPASQASHPAPVPAAAIPPREVHNEEYDQAAPARPIPPRPVPVPPRPQPQPAPKAVTAPAEETRPDPMDAAMDEAVQEQIQILWLEITEIAGALGYDMSLNPEKHRMLRDMFPEGPPAKGESVAKYALVLERLKAKRDEGSQPPLFDAPQEPHNTNAMTGGL